jgi:hypothetical protein
VAQIVFRGDGLTFGLDGAAHAWGWVAESHCDFRFA